MSFPAFYRSMNHKRNAIIVNLIALSFGAADYATARFMTSFTSRPGCAALGCYIIRPFGLYIGITNVVGFIFTIHFFQLLSFILLMTTVFLIVRVRYMTFTSLDQAHSHDFNIFQRVIFETSLLFILKKPFKFFLLTRLQFKFRC